ncbi:gluconate 2-dehydrogenase subunit 3 family protein [bacterium]|nr:gluconate 2-dehydrogenase subunit 3 family protein [bacterium]MBU1958873.1 gluconate 2-dehydrogenase subunit 3 family protein [bacterium]
MKKTITRRVFIASTIVAGTALMLLPQGAKTTINIEPFKVIEAVQEVLFPKGLQAPAASEFGATNYLLTVSTHSSFWADDLTFLHYGATLLMKAEPNFFTLNPKDKNDVLKNFVNSNKKAENWVSLILYYTIEALLSDPMYGGNKSELGWKWLKHDTGQPRPKTKFVGTTPLCLSDAQ